MTTKEKKTEKIIAEKSFKFKGRYTAVLGKRKTAVARIRIYKKGNGIIIVNKEKLSSYFSSVDAVIAKQPLKLTSQLNDLNISISVRGGGKKGQAEAIRNGIAKGLVKIDENYKDSLKAKGWLTRDSRKKERKKPGLKKARRAPQWSKR